MAQPNFFSPQTQWGASLSGLIDSLYSPDAEAKRAEREAKMQRDQADRDLKNAQIADYKAKREAEAAKSRQEATAISDMVAAMFGGAPQGQAVMDYRNAGGVQPNTLPAVDDMGDPVGQPPTIPMDRPAGYTPEAEGSLNRVLTGFFGERGLGGKNFEQAMKGSGQIQSQGFIDQIVRGLQKPETVAAAYGAVDGKPVFNDNQGRVLNQYSGALNESGAQAVASVGATNAKAAEDRAQAERARREGVPPIERVLDPSSPSGFKYVLRKDAVGMPAPAAPGATSAKDATIPTAPVITQVQKGDLDAAGTRAIITEARNLASDDRNFGFAGLVRETVQDAIQQGKALGRTLSMEGSKVQEDIARLGSDVGLQNFDPNLPQLDMMMNVLAFRMAKMNDPAGRVTDQDFKIAKNQIGGGGILSNQREFLSRLDLFERVLGQQQQIGQSFLNGRGRAGAITPAAPAAPVGPAPRIQYDAQGNRLN
jgi:hypothetical protein